MAAAIPAVQPLADGDADALSALLEEVPPCCLCCEGLSLRPLPASLHPACRPP